MAKILAIGIATLDIINTVESYPDEDSEVRVLKQHQTRGGNATNTLTVLSQLDHDCHWAGVLIDEPDSKAIVSELAHYHIDTSTCRQLATGKMPTSYITVSQQTGSRSIVHHRDCPEYSFKDFQAINLSEFDWIHFEGRNIDDTRLMLQHVTTHFPDLPCSLEIEKPRFNIEALFKFPTTFMFSQHYANAHGFDDAISLLKSLPANTTATCTWGQQGAWAISNNGEIMHNPAYQPLQVIDTLGAGDTFNAGLIHSLLNKHTLQQALNNACQLAGHKCGQQGFAKLLSNFIFQ
ncbi:MAG: ketohexokinase [Gammaproteobacteria bacterium]|nr:MAG: ketohexokinase [Gammaproteobacteria bacterium]